MQTHPGVPQHIGGNQRNGNGKIGQEAIGKQQLPHHAGLVRKGQRPAEITAGGRQGNGRHVRAGELNQGAAEEIAEPHAEGGHGKAGHVLVGTEGHRQEAVQKSHQRRANQAAQQRKQNGQEAVHLGSGHCLLIQKGTNHAADAAHIHNAGDAQVQVAGLFRNGLAGGAEQQRHTLHHRPGNKGKEVKHLYFSSFPPVFRREIL